jgi:hypothetical protein
MDAKQDQHPPMQGDDELAKALQGGLQFEETPVPGDQTAATPPTPAAPVAAMPDPLDEPPTLGISLPQPEDSEPEETPTVQKPHDTKDEPKKTAINATAAGSSELDKLKASALEELRPLVGKLSLPADEKFDTLLLIIRSTDDQSLLDEAHAAAKEITDDTKRAQALLDIIKEIDYFSTKR